ncbi:MAG: NACHT domain-containing protein [Ktedonobacteraceae bacterium]
MGILENEPKELVGSADDEGVHLAQGVSAEAGSSISNIGQTIVNGDIINGTVNNTGRDVIHHHFYITSRDAEVQAAYSNEITAARARFEAYLETGLKKWAASHAEEACYVEPTLLWQHDIEENEFLRDPDAREAWLEITGRTFSVSLSEMVRHGRVLVLGEFHAGKTRLLQHLRQTILRQRESDLVQRDPAVPIPIFLPLRNYSNPDESFSAYMQQSLYEIYGPASDESVLSRVMLTDGMLRAGRYVFLLDGLDELSGPKRRELLRHIRDFVSRYPHHSYVLSSRRSAYGAIEAHFIELGFALLAITPFSAQQVQRYLEQRNSMETPLAEALRQRRDLLALARIPGLLKLLCDFWEVAAEIPQRLSALYEKLLHELLTKEIWRDTVVIPHPGLTRQVLDLLALEMTCGKVINLPDEELEDLVQRLITQTGLSASYSAREWIEEIRHREILVAGGDGVSFQHRSWQEYLTAHALKEVPLADVVERSYVKRESASGFNPWWYQVLRFLAELRPDILEALYEREEIIGARCTPLDADGHARQRAFESIFSLAAATKMGLDGPFHTPRDFFNDRRTCLDLNPPGAVLYLRERYRDESVAPVIRDDAFGLLVDYAANDNNEAMDTVLELLPGLLSADEDDWGLRETAAYAVSRLELREFVPQLLSLFETEQNEFVRRAIIWALATLAPRQARPIFSRLLIQRLGTRLPGSASEQALTVALPHLLDDQLVNEVRHWLLHTARDIVALPDPLVGLVVKHGTKASQELLLVMSTHFLVASSLSQDARLSIYQALSSHPTSSIRYLLDHFSETYVAPREIARALAWLLDESTLDECRDALTSSALPAWPVHLTYQMLSDTGKLNIAERLVSYRGDVLTRSEPEESPARPAMETLGELLSQPGWQAGAAFGSHAGDYLAQVDTLPPEHLNQLQEYVVEQLNQADFAQSFRLLDERQGIYTPYLLVCISYAAALRIDVTPDLYRRLLSIDFEDSSIATLCEQSYLPERDDDIIAWIRADAPHSCLLRAAELCGRHNIQPRKVVPALGEAIKALCQSKREDRSYSLNVVYRLIQVLCRYGRKGANTVESLIGAVDDDCSLQLAKTRMTISPPSVSVETFYLQHLAARANSGDVQMWDREMQSIRTPQAVPFLFDLLRTLIVRRGGPMPPSTGIQDETSSLPGVMSAEMKTSLLLTGVLSTLTRLASAEVLQGYESLQRDFPGESWLSRYSEDARRVYLARQ